GQYPFAFIAQRQIHGSGNLLPNRGVPFNLLADRLYRRMRAQKAVGQRLVFAQQAQQQVLRLYVRRAELAGLVSCKEDYAPGFLCVPLEHIPLTQMLPVTSAGNISLSFWLRTAHLTRKEAFLSCQRSPSQESIKLLRRTNLHLPNRQKKPKNCPSPLLANLAIRAALPLLCRDATAIHDRSDA